ncbi:MAG: nucleotide pyrophosphohydrolase [Chitinophagia bacterium]|nr:nucleotide pyrophosphohydrolase [Chitinophagia bacterium]
MSDIAGITERLVRFRDERDWEKFHNPKDLAMAISIEAGELMEAFLWKPSPEADIERVKDELADILSYSLLLAHHYGFDVAGIVREKVDRNSLRYPVEKSKGNARKHDEL